MKGTFGPYRLDELLGRGGMGEVYRAVDTRKSRIVALKVLGAGLGDDPDFRTRFRREAELAARLHDPHVVPIHDYGEIDGRLYIDMRLVDGRDLARALRDRGALSPDAAVDVVGQIASALDSAHRAGLIHRDVKPSNILLIERGSAPPFAYLADFGIVRDTSGTTGTSAALVGSLDYMAPERFEGSPGDRPADVYALAAVLHEALTGHKPFPARSLPGLMHAHLYGAVPVPSAVVGSLPVALDAVVARGMAKDPAERFPTAGALAGAATAALRGGGPSGPAVHGPANPPPRRRRVYLAIGGAVATLVVVVTAVLLATAPDAPTPEAAPPGTTPTPTPAPAAAANVVTTIDDIFGPACELIPTEGAGSAAGMIDDPVALAASANPLLTTLSTAIGSVPGLAETLDSAEALTVLAPFNGAFDAVPPDAMDALLADPVTMRQALLRHVAPARYDAEGLVEAGSINVLTGETLVVGGTADAPTFDGGSGDVASTLCGNIPTANATLFVVDTVLLPTI